MAFIKGGIAAVALMAALGACASGPEAAAPEMAAPASAKSALDTAIEAAGGEAALSKVRELEWTGTATVVADGKTTEINVATVLRPMSNWARTTSWLKDAKPVTGKTIQAELGKAWAVNRVSWTPMPEAQAVHENQQFALYSLMLLTPLKVDGAKVTEGPAAADGTRTIKGVLADGRMGELKVDAAGKLVGAGLVVRDPTGAGADIVETVKFSGEIVSNGVKWPKRITIEQGGKPYFDLEIATFEANTAPKPRPLPHTLDEEQQAPAARGANGG